MFIGLHVALHNKIWVNDHSTYLYSLTFSSICILMLYIGLHNYALGDQNTIRLEHYTNCRNMIVFDAWPGQLATRHQKYKIAPPPNIQWKGLPRSRFIYIWTSDRLNPVCAFFGPCGRARKTRIPNQNTLRFQHYKHCINKMVFDAWSGQLAAGH